MIDYVSRQADGDFGFITHKANETQSTSTIITRSKSNSLTKGQQNRKMCDLDFADDIALLENEMIRSQQQFDSYSTNAAKVGLQINGQKTYQIILNPTEDFDHATSLKYNGLQQIKIYLDLIKSKTK